MEPEKPSRLTDDQWRYLAWLSVVVGILAVGAIVAVMIGSITRTPEAARTAATSTTTTTTIDPEHAPRAVELIDTPVTEPIVIEKPRIGAPGRYHRAGSVVMVRVTIDACERSEGMIRAAGTIENLSKVGQTFDYVIDLEIRRPVTNAQLAQSAIAIDHVAPGEAVEWSVEEPATKITKVRCSIEELTVVPAGDTAGI